jgi:hypothetical protein
MTSTSVEYVSKMRIREKNCIIDSIRLRDLKPFLLEERNKNDIDLVLAVINTFPSINLYKYASINLLDSEEFAYCIVGYPNIVDFFKFLSEKIKNDKEIVRIAITTKSSILKYVNKQFQDDEEIVTLAVTNSPNSLEYVSIRLRNNEKVIKSFIKSGGTLTRFVGKQILSNKEIVIMFVKLNNSCLDVGYIDKKFFDDKDVVIAGIKFFLQNPMSISKRLLADEEIGMILVGNKGLYLEYLDKILQDNEKVVMLSVKNDGISLRYASDRLKKSKSIVLAAVDKDLNSLSYIDESLKLDRDVVIKSLSTFKNGTRRIYINFDIKFKDDEEVILLFIFKIAEYFEFVSDRLKKSKTFLYKIEMFCNAKINGFSSLVYIYDSLDTELQAEIDKDSEYLSYFETVYLKPAK